MGQGISLLPHPSALPPRIRWLQQRPMLTAGDTEHVTPVLRQLLADWPALHSLGLAPAGRCPCFTSTQFPQTAFSAVVAERSVNKQPV